SGGTGADSLPAGNAMSCTVPDRRRNCARLKRVCDKFMPIQTLAFDGKEKISCLDCAGVDRIARSYLLVIKVAGRFSEFRNSPEGQLHATGAPSGSSVL